MIELSERQGLPTLVDAAAAAMQDGATVVLPTDTVYGLACDPRRPEAVDEVYRLKDRPSGRLLPIIVTGIEQARALGLAWTDAADRLADAFWPGPLTIAVGVERPAVDWLGGRTEVAVRAPAHDLCLALAERTGGFCMTSANRHNNVTPASLHEALADLAGEPGVAIDGGALSVVSSSLVNVNLSEPAIEREGAVPAERVREVLASVRS